MNKKLNTFVNIKSAEVDAKKGVVIEGYANYNAMDRVKERMDVNTVRLENFKKNPILLFNHCMDTPVGKVIDLEPRKDGLYVKARISGSNNTKVSYIRDLVLEGVLKAFSIRYDIDDYKQSFVDDPLNEGGKLIKDWELQELSIVTIPCQQDSLFSLSGIKSLGEAREMALNEKGARSAALINKAMDVVVKKGSDKSELIEKLSQLSGIEQGDIAEILAGNITPIPDQFREAAEQVLNVDAEAVANADAEDLEKSPEPVPEEEKKKAIDPAVHENPMIERLDSLVAIMGTVATKLDGLAQILEGQATPEKADYKEVDPEEEKGSEYKDEEEKGSAYKEDSEEKYEEKDAGDAEEMEAKESMMTGEMKDDQKEHMEEEEEEKAYRCEDEDEKGSTYKEEEEDEETQMKKGVEDLRAKYGEKCKDLGIDLEDLLKDCV